MESNNKIIPPLLETQSLPKIKPLFLAKTKWRCSVASDIHYINKYKPKMLNALEITHSNDVKMNPKSLRQLRKALVDAKKISSLAIQKDDVQRTFQTKNRLGYLLNSSNHLQKLFFRFTDKTMNKVLNENTVQNLTRLRRCKDLSSLEIHFSCHEQTKNNIITHLSSQLRGLTKLKVLTLDIKSCRSDTYRGASRDYDPNAPLLNFKYPRCLSSLILHFESATSVNQETLSIFISSLQRCHQLKSLNLNLNGLFTAKTSAFSVIWSPLFKNTSLQLLTLFINLTEKNIHPFLDGFSYLKNLISLNLHISSDLSGERFKFFITTLYSHLASFPSFKSLTLRISALKVHSEFGLLFPQIRHLTQLEQLEIGFPLATDLSKSHLQSLSQALQSLQDLKKLHLNFPTEEISLEGVISIAQSLKNLGFLTTLSLQFPYANLNSKAVQAISDSTAHLPLNNLSLHLGQSDTNFFRNLWKEKPKLTPLFSTLYDFKLLTRLDLNLSAFKLSIAEAKHFSLAVKELKQLCGFSITFPRFDPENNYEGLRRFLASFKEIRKLSSLSISFREEKTINEEVKHLAESLQDCRYLRTLNVHFEEADQLTQDSLRSLSMGLKALELLKGLELSFIRRTEPELLESLPTFELLESLTTLKYLESLRLGFAPSSALPEIKLFAKDMIERQKFRRLTYFVINYDRIG